MTEQDEDDPPSLRSTAERNHWLHRLHRLGFETAQAEILVDTDHLDLHLVEQALREGCPLRTAFSIFS